MSGLKTSAKCVLYTSKGDLEVELWAKECPLTCRHFIESSQRGNFNNDSFNNYIKGKYLSLVRSTGNGQSEKLHSIEYNSRLSISQDGILSWDIKNETFLISTDEWLNYPRNELTIFGKLVGGSIYKLREWLRNDLENDSQGTKFIYPPIINNIEITIPYFNYISADQPREDKPAMPSEPPRKKMKSVAKVKLSFNDDEEDEEEYGDLIPMKTKIRMKASPLLYRRQKKHNTKIKSEPSEVDNRNTKEIPTDKFSESSSDAPSEFNDTTSTIQNKSNKKVDPMALLAKMRAANNGKNIFS